VDRIKQLIGRMVRPVKEQRGLVVDQKNVNEVGSILKGHEIPPP
jgi:hypothetical protein